MFVCFVGWGIGGCGVVGRGSKIQFRVDLFHGCVLILDEVLVVNFAEIVVWDVVSGGHITFKGRCHISESLFVGDGWAFL